MASLSTFATAFIPQNFVQLPYDNENRLIGNWIMFKEAFSDTNVCRDEIFSDPENWLHRKDVVDLFNLAYLTEDDYNMVIQNQIGM